MMEYPQTIEYDERTYKKDNYACSFLNKAFSGNLRAVYSNTDKPPTKDGLFINCPTEYLIINAKWRRLLLTTSEWGSLEYVD